MNKLYVGLKKEIKLPKRNYLLIDDKIEKRPYARLFDPTKHCLNPLLGMDYRKATDFVDILDAIFSRGDSTLTKDTGLDFIAEQLEGKPKSLEDLIPEPDKKSSTGHVWAFGKVRRLLRSPVLKRMLCGDKQFSFNPRSTILAKVDRVTLGEFDALVVGLLMMAQYRGQLVVPDLGFYGRDVHAGLIREGRLIAGVNFLSELPPRLRQSVLLMEKVPAGTTVQDAETLALYARLMPGTNEYNDFVQAAIV